MVTHAELYQYTLVIVAIISFIVSIYKNSK